MSREFSQKQIFALLRYVSTLRNVHSAKCLPIIRKRYCRRKIEVKVFAGANSDQEFCAEVLGKADDSSAANKTNALVAHKQAISPAPW